MKNKKGVLVAEVICAQLFIFAFVAAAWHIPAWSKAKADHKEAQYQSQKMWPQQDIAKWPGGADYQK